MCVWVVKRKEVHVSIEAFGKLAPLHVSLSIPHVSQITPKLIDLLQPTLHLHILTHLCLQKTLSLPQFYMTVRTTHF